MMAKNVNSIATNGTNGQVLIGSTSTGIPIYANITSLDSTVTITVGSNSIDLSVGGTPLAPKITVYDTAGTHSWTKSAGVQNMIVVVIGGGSGGGGGNNQSFTGLVGGGSGGAGGTTIYWRGPAAFWPASVTATVGAGGAGGAGDSGPGPEDGSPGSASIFAYLHTAVSVNAQGKAGSTGTVTGGSGTQNKYVSQTGLISLDGIATVTGNSADGGNGGNSTGSTAIQANTDYVSSTGGGGGAGASAVSEQNGGNGGNIPNIYTTVAFTYWIGGAGGTESIVIDGGAGTDYNLTSTGFFFGGTGGGGGGGQNLGLVAGNGGNGGKGGGGGGGGGGALTGAITGGNGGNGGDGLIVVIEYYS
jgi:hypothetical protein